jgi:carbonic anhydrase/acetyltransferase-like protein (isoleucine patch superfamily)
MWVEHRGRRPHVDPSAWVAGNATLSGAVTIGPGARVLYGAVLTAEAGAEVVVGRECVIMEHAVLRGAGRFPLHLGDRVLVGPHAYLSGCRIGDRSFIATAAMVFNGAAVGSACVVALGGKVHIDTELPDETWVPMGYIAFGRPACVSPPDQAPTVHEALNRVGFMRYVFGVDAAGRTRGEVMDAVMERYARALGAHATDRVMSEPSGEGGPR